jgi:hypothetical protein
MKTYFIVNACILDSEPSIRDEQYKNGISKLIELTKDMENIQIIIVENNGGKQKYLEDYNNDVNCTTFYTNNNRHIETGNIGIKELIDVIHCISRFDIGDDDFIVKMNGRYVLNDDSEFIAALKNTGIVQITNTPPTVQDALVAEEEPTVQDASVAEEEPTVPVQDASVAVEEAPVPVQDAPTVPVAEEEPTVQDASVAEEEPTVQDASVAEEAPTVPVEEAPTVQDASVAEEEAPTVPVEEQSVEEEPVPVEEQSVQEEPVPVQEEQAPNTSSENLMTFEFEAPKVITTNETHCIIKYGSYDTPLTYRTGECISAIIGMRGKYAKQINIPRMEEKVENVWAAASLQIDEQNIVMLEKLGINVCPGGNDYFLV